MQGGMTAYYLAYRSKHVDVAKTLYQAHNVQTTLLTHLVSTFVLNRHVLLHFLCLIFNFKMTPPSGEPAADNTSSEVLNYISILLDRLKKPPLLMDPDYPTAGRKRRRWASEGHQKTFGSHLLAVGAS